MTFAENARAKALYYAAATGELTVDEDPEFVECATGASAAAAHPIHMHLVLVDVSRSVNPVRPPTVGLNRRRRVQPLKAKQSEMLPRGEMARSLAHHAIGIGDDAEKWLNQRIPITP